MKNNVTLSFKPALIEFYPSHQEVLIAQIQAFEMLNISFSLYISKRLFDVVKNNPYFSKAIVFDFENGVLKHWKELFRLKKQLKNDQISHLIINTANGKILRNFSLIAPKSVKYLGIMHNTMRFFKKGTQTMINKKVKNYFVLNDWLLLPQGRKAQPFYALDHRLIETTKQNKHTKLTLCIPGRIEFHRRNYKLLIRLAQWAKEKQLPISFVLLGSCQSSDGITLQAEIKALGLASFFMLFDHFIEDEQFIQNLGQAHLVLPLIDPEVSMFEKYTQYQISGAYNLAFAARKPMILHKDFSKHDDFAQCFFYSNFEEIKTLLSELINDQALIVNKAQEMGKNTKFNPLIQANNYLFFIKNCQ